MYENNLKKFIFIHCKEEGRNGESEKEATANDLQC